MAGYPATEPWHVGCAVEKGTRECVEGVELGVVYYVTTVYSTHWRKLEGVLGGSILSAYQSENCRSELCG